jgi:hypothetical protein
VTRRSVNLVRELKNYKWKEDASGKPMNIPIDRFNHAIDAIRYACLGRLFHGQRIIKTAIHKFKLTNSKSGKFQELLTAAHANTAPLIRIDSNYDYFYK